jgi:hypothetical protein
MAKLQYRGNCPLCGAQQAVLHGGKGVMAKHGYTVDNGWFNGVCNGQNHPPMQVARDATERMIHNVRADVEKLLLQAQQLKDGKIFPSEVKDGTYTYAGMKRVANMIPFATATERQQKEAVAIAITNTENRARAGTGFANDMENLLNNVYGKPLLEVKAADAPTQIRAGDKRRFENGRIATVRYQDGARVYYTVANTEGKTFQGWIGTQAFRKLPVAE